jgi:hypothetical protein
MTQSLDYASAPLIREGDLIQGCTVQLSLRNRETKPCRGPVVTNGREISDLRRRSTDEVRASPEWGASPNAQRYGWRND